MLYNFVLFRTRVLVISATENKIRGCGILRGGGATVLGQSRTRIGSYRRKVNRLKGLKLKGLKLKGLNSQQIKTLKGLGPIHVPLTPLKGNFYFFDG